MIHGGALQAAGKSKERRQKRVLIMDHDSDRKYEALKIPKHPPNEEKDSRDPAPRTERALRKQSGEELFYEIEYDASPWPGVGKYVLRSAEIKPPPRDEIRERFYRMRDIAREDRSWYLGRGRFYDGIAKRENGSLFYKQAVFMEDFQDDYGKTVPYFSYYPLYQMMGYEQLRTYFTWRTKVRKGFVEETSVSYAFLYIYELLNNIGAENPVDGLEKLMFFWKAFREYDRTIDKYLVKWLKDYHVYYELPWSFKDFVTENDLESFYPQIMNAGDDFDRMCSVSRYDLRKSVFYTEDRADLIKNCFYYTEDRVRQAFQTAGMDYDRCIFPPVKNMAIWTPFQGALFFPWLKQPDRQVILGGDERYVCSKNSWRYHKTIVLENGRKLLGYIMKQMEAVLRKITKYKYSIRAGLSMMDPVTVTVLDAEGISLEKLVTEAVKEFFRETTKTVVRVNPAALEKIRQEAMITQEKLTVEEEPRETEGREIPGMPLQRRDAAEEKKETVPPRMEKKEKEEPLPEARTEPDPDDPWAELRLALSGAELGALTMTLDGGTHLKEYADQQGIMLEVLADGINEKAMDVIGDSILDEEFAVYEDYMDQVKEMVKKR